MGSVAAVVALLGLAVLILPASEGGLLLMLAIALTVLGTWANRWLASVTPVRRTAASSKG